MDKVLLKIVPYFDIDTRLALGIKPQPIELPDIEIPENDESCHQISENVFIVQRSIWYPSEFTFEKWTRQMVDDENMRWTIEITRSIFLRDGRVITESWTDTEMSPEWWTPSDDIETSDTESIEDDEEE